MEIELKKRFQSFAWRVGAVTLVALLNAVAANLEVLELPIWAVGMLGLVLGEITKLLNNIKLGKVR